LQGGILSIQTLTVESVIAGADEERTRRTDIDDDIPRDDQDKKMEFDAAEIVRELHDQGDDGRLFRMPRF
jgi:uncharacterized protein YydD (DUF2326 family)